MLAFEEDTERTHFFKDKDSQEGRTEGECCRYQTWEEVRVGTPDGVCERLRPFIRGILERASKEGSELFYQ